MGETSGMDSDTAGVKVTDCVGRCGCAPALWRLSQFPESRYSVRNSLAKAVTCRDFCLSMMTNDSPSYSAGYRLGLYLCRVIAEAHGGKLILRSELGKGTEVEVVLPLESVSEQP